MDAGQFGTAKAFDYRPEDAHPLVGGSGDRHLGPELGLLPPEPIAAARFRAVKRLGGHAQRHIQFRLPNASMRRELLALHLTNPERVKADLRSLAEQSR